MFKECFQSACKCNAALGGNSWVIRPDAASGYGTARSATQNRPEKRSAYKPPKAHSSFSIYRLLLVDRYIANMI